MPSELPRSPHGERLRSGRVTTPGNGESNGAEPSQPGSGTAVGVEHEAPSRVVAQESHRRRVDKRRQATAAFTVGLLREARGDLPGAEEAYRRAGEHGHGAATSNLGVLLHEGGDLAGAEEAYRRASERGESIADFNLGVLLEERRNLADAEMAYSRADERGNRAAASNLGVLLEERGDVAGAETAYRRADERGDDKGALNLGMLLADRGDLPGAEAAYWRAHERHREIEAWRVTRGTMLESPEAIGVPLEAPTEQQFSPPPPTERASAPLQRSPRGETKKRVLAALADGRSRTAGELAAETGLARGTVSSTLFRLVEKGELVKAERGYRLPISQGAPAPLPTTAALTKFHGAWIALSMAIGLLVCSVADGLSRATLAAPSVIFWAGILLIVLPVFFRLSSAEPSTHERLALVCFLGLALFGVKYLQNPFLYTYSDELAHQYNAAQIVQHHHLFNDNPLLGVTAKYPGLAGVTSALIEMTGMSAFGAGLLVIGTARLVLLVGLFLLFARISGSPRVAGLGAAIYTANSNFLFFDAQFSYESLALPLFVVVLAMVAERGVPPRSLAPPWALPIVLGTSAVVVTHHVTSYALTAVLVGLTVVHFAIRSRTPSPWPFALLAALLTAFWLVVVASLTVGYLTPVFGHAFSAAVQTIAGESKPRHLFSGAGSPAPLGDQIVALGSVALLVAALPFGLWQVWCCHRTQPFAWLLSGGAVALFGTFLLRFAPAAWETAGRAEGFLFIGLSFVLACLPVEVLITRRTPWLGRALLTGCFGIVFIGGIISGWPVSSLLSQPLRVAAGGHVVESERLALGRWAASHLPDQRFLANETDARVLMDYGHASVSLNGAYPADYQDVIQSPGLASWELAIVRNSHVGYVVVDRQVSPNLFFSVRGARARLVPASTMLKFQLAPAAPIFDSGEIIVYDMNDQP